jgi:plasmid stabilization system protein ParE
VKQRREVRHSTASHEDYAALIEYLVDTRGLGVASAVDAKLERAISSLSAMASRGRIVPELRSERGPEFREIISGTYRIIYRIVEDEVWIVAIVDGHRDVDELLLGRAERFQIGKVPP